MTERHGYAEAAQDYERRLPSATACHMLMTLTPYDCLAARSLSVQFLSSVVKTLTPEKHLTSLASPSYSCFIHSVFHLLSFPVTV